MTTFDYSPTTRYLTKATVPQGNGYRYEYDSRKNLTKITRVSKTNQGADAIIYEAYFSPSCTNQKTCNKPVWIKDAKGNQTDFAYDSTHGGLLSATLPADANGIRRAIIYTYTPYDTGEGILYRLTQTSACITGSSCAGTADEERTTTNYWNHTFLPSSITHASGSLSTTTSYVYDSAGRPTQIIDPKQNTTYYRYDAVERRTGEISAPGTSGARQAKRYTYNNDDQVTVLETGTVTGVTDADWNNFVVLQTLTTTYDALGRKARVAMKGTDGIVYSVTDYSYDPENRLKCTAVRMNSATWGSQPLDACTLTFAGTQGPDRITRNVYNIAGELQHVQKDYGTNLQQDYVSYTYTLNGKHDTVIDANGNKASYSYDRFDRQTIWAFPSTTTPGAASTTDFEQYGYDANDNRTSLRKRDGREIDYAYDALNRVTSKTFMGGGACVLGYACTTPPTSAVRNVYYTYDLRGLQTYARFDSATGTDNVYNVFDGLGRLAESTVNMGGVSRRTTFGYDANSNKISIKHPDGQRFNFTYDGLNRIAAANINYGAQFLSNSYYSNGALCQSARGAAPTTIGTLCQSVSGAVVTTYTYDPVMRLASLADDLSGTAADVSATFNYNWAGQIATQGRSNDSYGYANYTVATTAYGANGLNQYTTVGAGSLGYDSNGNLASTGGTTFTYDVENRLVAATGTLSTNMVYDPMGRLYQTSSASGIRQFVYDGDQRIAEYDGSSGALLRRYIHGNGDDDPLIWFEGSGLSDMRSLQTDHQGSIVSVADATGALIAINTYDEYGVPGSGNVGSFQYTGQAWLPDLGMYYYKARIYSGKLGRFLQTDPVGYKDQNNLYAYVGNDPIDGRDPSGLDTVYNLPGEKIIVVPVVNDSKMADKTILDGYNIRGIDSHGTKITVMAVLAKSVDSVHFVTDPTLDDTSQDGKNARMLMLLGGGRYFLRLTQIRMHRGTKNVIPLGVETNTEAAWTPMSI